MRRNEKTYYTYLQKIHTASIWSKWELPKLKPIAQELRLININARQWNVMITLNSNHLEWKAGNR